LEAEPLPPKLWSQARELGWFEIDLRESATSEEMGLAAVAAIFEEAGRSLFPGPLFDTAVFAPWAEPILRLGSDGLVIAFASAEAGSNGMPSSAGTRISGSRITGHKMLVPYADHAGVLVVLGAEAGAAALVAVRPRSAGVTIASAAGLDLASRPCEVRFEDAEVVAVIAAGIEAEALLDRVRLLANVLFAARSVGLMRTVLEMSVNYALARKQFGKVIGSFQAIQHRLAEMAVTVTVAASACRAAENAVEMNAGAADTMARAAHAFAARSARTVAESALQIHGGIGFTEEYPLHLYLKHAVAGQGLWGGPEHQADVLGNRRLMGNVN
jgi:acyl-CoA dehydrogenase